MLTLHVPPTRFLNHRLGHCLRWCHRRCPLLHPKTRGSQHLTPKRVQQLCLLRLFRRAKLHSAPLERGGLGCGSRALSDGRGFRGLKAGDE